MNMWIRSQDKTELIQGFRIQADNNKIYTYEQHSGENWVELGEYKSKERALEVLDLIQYELRHIKYNNEYSTITIYEMPLE